MEEIINIVIKLVAALLALGISWACKWVVTWLKTSINAQYVDELDIFIGELVAAAEQMFKKEDADGSIRLEYVQKMLVEAGVEITDVIRASIEAKVFSINNSGGVTDGVRQTESN